MILPPTVRVLDGLTVEGASPGLLSELLEAYSFELKARDRMTFDALLPGLEPEEIHEKFATIGLEPPEELVVWWGWRNGFRLGNYVGARPLQLTVAQAVRLYEAETLGITTPATHDPLVWNPSWIRVAGGGSRSVAVRCGQRAVPLVRYVDPEFTGSQDWESAEHQVVSLCTVVTWQLLAIAKRWTVFDQRSGIWVTDWDRYPLEWQITDLI